MNDYSKQIFANPQLLRQKLELYLQSPAKIEIYAKFAEKAFAKGMKNDSAVKPSWSWWAFFFAPLFFIYKKCYSHGILLTVLSSFFHISLLLSFLVGYFFIHNNELENFLSIIMAFGVCIVFLLHIFYAIFAKYIIIKRFANSLSYEDDNVLMAMGGKDSVSIYIISPIAGFGLDILGTLFALITMLVLIKTAPTKTEVDVSSATTDIMTLVSDVSAYYTSTGELAKFDEMTNVPLSQTKITNKDMSATYTINEKECIEIYVENKDGLPFGIRKGKDNDDKVCKKLYKEKAIQKLMLEPVNLQNS